MKYDVISADCHVDLIWLPPDLFTANAPAGVKDRMPFVTEGPRGKEWVTKNGASFGLDAGMGSAGRQYVTGAIHRSDRMASTGLYEDGRKGVRRLTDPDLRLKFFFSSRRRHTIYIGDWSSDVCSSDLGPASLVGPPTTVKGSSPAA